LLAKLIFGEVKVEVITRLQTMYGVVLHIYTYFATTE
jgi:hypothetical protein